MQVRPVITRMRRRLGDMQSVAYSDYELIESLNDAQRIFYIALAENFSGIPRKKKEIAIAGTVGDLPVDYYSLIEIEGNGRAYVEGRQVVVPDMAEGKVALVYNRVPLPPANEMTDEIDIPHTILLEAVEIAVLVARGDMNGATETAIASAKRIGNKREIGRIPDSRWVS